MAELTDSELLERAAKAAGIAAYWSTDGTIQQRPILVVKAGGAMGTMPYELPWNPRSDDAQCARLEASCEIDVSWRPEYVHACAVRKDGTAVESHEYYARHRGDKNKARRYASTRAAASLATEGGV